MSTEVVLNTTEFDSWTYREVMGNYPTGVVVASAMINGAPLGMVVGTFNSVSLEPPLVSFMPMRTSSTYAKLRRAERVCVSVLAHDQMDVCRTLATKDPEKFEKVSWKLSPMGAPMIDGALAYVEGQIAEEVEAGDHYITIISVDALETHRSSTPLLFFQGGYGGFSTTGLSAHVDESLISAVRLAEAARPQLDALAEKYECSAAALVQISPVDQTIGATSYGLGTEVEERIGVRIPLIPPLGEAAVAWSPHQLDNWVQRVFPADQQSIDEYYQNAETVRSQGYAISRADQDPEGYEQLSQALAEWGQGELTPARDRAVRQIIADSQAHFGSSITEGETNINLTSLVVPVFAPGVGVQKNSGLVLRLGNLPQGVDSSVVSGWIDSMQEAAEEVKATLAGASAKDYQRYVDAGLRGETERNEA